MTANTAYRVFDEITGETHEGEDLYTIIRGLFLNDDPDILSAIETLVDAYERGEYIGGEEAYLGIRIL